MLRRRITTVATQRALPRLAMALGSSWVGGSIRSQGGCPMSGGAATNTAPASGSSTGGGVCPMSGMAKTGCPAEEAPTTMKFKDIVNQMGKQRLSAFVTGTASAGYILCGGSNPLVLTAVTLGTYCLSLSANTANQYLEVEYDRQMKRTCRRPLVIGAITPTQALQLSFTEFATGTAMLAAVSGPAAALGIANWVMYVGVYTPLKRISTTNTWWGAIVGLIPPLMGGVAATGGALSPFVVAIQPAYVLGGLVFAWQIPHFMSLAFFCRRDYEAAGFKMLPYNHPTRASVYAVALSVVMAALTLLGPPYGNMPVEAWYLVLATAANTVMIYKAWMFHVDPVKYCRSCFVFSYMYLAFMIVLLCVNHAQPVALAQRMYQRFSAAAEPRPTDDAELAAGNVAEQQLVPLHVKESR